ncbi:hypothetical protein IQ07DRAFT_605085 [Pyrenochaeta sp. DS3sAY3a]|nr:hypothetical protein IQ07DRAFT_605085 [Pyrenochaeta sp. DS3sAY3a]
MLFTKPLLALGLVGAVHATWDIDENRSFSYKDEAQKESMTKAYVSAVESYYATITTGSEWNKAWDVLRAYQQTGRDVPAAVTATDTVLTYSTTPAWYAAMPTEAKKVFDDMDKKREDIQASIQADANKKNDAARPGAGLSMYVGAAFAAAVAGVVAAL